MEGKFRGRKIIHERGNHHRGRCRLAYGARDPQTVHQCWREAVIVYTLEAFQEHPLVDAIEVVCLAGWEQVLRAYARQYKIDKLKWVVKGGASGQESIRNGVYNFEGVLAEDDICIVHDGVRPMLDPEVITDVVRVAKERGNAVTSMPYNERFSLWTRRIPPPLRSTSPARRFVVCLHRRPTVLGSSTPNITRLLRKVSESTAPTTRTQ